MSNILEYLELSSAASENKIIDIKEECNFITLLNDSKKIGTFLSKKVSFNTPICVIMEKSVKTLKAFLGILQCGCYYCLLNPQLPVKRLKNIKDTLNSEFVITDNEHLNIARSIFDENNIFLIDQLLKNEINQKKLDEIRMKFTDNSPLYVNFTSGSTGSPKGVTVSHKSVIDFIDVFTEEFNINKNDVIANQAPFDFDVSVKDIYSSLKTGASLVIVPKEYFLRPKELIDFLCDNKVTILIWAVSALCLITTFHGLDYRVPDTIKKIMFSGEIMPIKHLKEWMNAIKNASFINLYGPTEITCNCTFHRITKSDVINEKIPIGKAFNNEKVFLLDKEDKEILKENIEGEICVGGTCVSLGYFNNINLTNEKFIQNPLNKSYREIIYRTGDIGYFNENKDIVFVGRKDFQIKHLGHRIELEEIERITESVNDVIRACCIYDDEKKRIYLFYVGKINKELLNKNLIKLLPIYMIPNKLIQLDMLPLTKNGKIDRNKLMEIQRS